MKNLTKTHIKYFWITKAFFRRVKTKINEYYINYKIKPEGFNFILFIGLKMNEFFKPYNLLTDYERITYDTKKFLENENEKNLKRVINDYLDICDFINSMYYIDLYIEKKYRKYKKYIKMKKQLNLFLEEISGNLKDKKNIVTFWNDCVSYDELEWFPNLNKKKKNSLFFENVYTPTPYTTPTMFAMVDKKKNIESFYNYRERNMNYDNSILLNMLQIEGYEFKYFSYKDRHAVFVDELKYSEHHEFSSSCRLCFDAICQLLRAKKAQHIIIHCVTETHFPFFFPKKDGKELEKLYAFNSVDMLNKKSKSYNQVLSAAKYWDEQEVFFSEIIGQSSIQIFMSDHGKYYVDDNYSDYGRKRHHVLFMAQGESIPSQNVKSILSLEDYADIIRNFVFIQKGEKKSEELNWEELHPDNYVLMQQVDTYSKQKTNFYVAANMKKSGHAYRGVITPDEIYVKTRCDRFYFIGNNEKNMVDDCERAERVAELDQLAGDYFIDIFADEKFVNSRCLY